MGVPAQHGVGAVLCDRRGEPLAAEVRVDPRRLPVERVHDRRIVMEQAGLRTERPPEGWLYKAWHENSALIDPIFALSGGPITDETIKRAPLLEVSALRVHVFTLVEGLGTIEP